MAVFFSFGPAVELLKTVGRNVLHRTAKESWNETGWRSNSELKVTVEEHSKRQRRELQTLDQSFAGSN